MLSYRRQIVSNLQIVIFKKNYINYYDSPLLINHHFRKNYSTWKHTIPSSTASLHPKFNNVIQNKYSLSVLNSNKVINDDKMDKIFFHLDVELHKKGRITKESIENILSNIKYSDSVNSSQCLFLIRCCGNYIPNEYPDVRTNLVHKVLEILEKNNILLDISHYNALLKIYLENEYKFSPSDFIIKLEQKGLQPNRVTFQRLISRYCQEGDLSGATKILEYIKENDLSINEAVFNSLIIGHARANDYESAENILKIMKNTGLEPSSETYCHLLCAFAEKGNLEKICTIVSECESKEIILQDKHLFEVIMCLAKHGHPDKIEKIIPLFTKQIGFNQECVNTILQLTTHNLDNVAFKLLLEMLPLQTYDLNEPGNSGNFFFTQLVKMNMNVAKIVFYHKELKNRKLNNVGILKALESALHFKKQELIISLLNEIRNEGLPIRNHYFWPLLAHYRNNKDQHGLISVLKIMANFCNHEIDYDTMKNYVIPGISGTAVSKVDILEAEGFKNTFIVTPLLYDLICKSEIEEAIDIVLMYKSKLFPNMLRQAMVQTLNHPHNTHIKVKLLKLISQKLSTEDSYFTGYVITGIANNVKNHEQIEYFTTVLKECIQQDVLIPLTSVEIIQRCLGDNITPELNILLTKLSSINSVNEDKPDLDCTLSLTKSELEDKLLQAKNNGAPTFNILKQLFYLEARSNNLSNSLSIYNELQHSGEIPAGLSALLIELHVVNNNLKEAHELYLKEKKKNCKFTLALPKLLQLANLLLANGHVEDTLQLLDDVAFYKSQIVPLNMQCIQLLNVAVQQPQSEVVEQIYRKLIERQLIVDGNSVFLSYLIKAHLANNNLNDAVLKYEEFVKKFHVTPLKDDLIKHLIKSGEEEKLQKVIDLSMGVHGEINIIYDLVFCFIECHQLKQARKLLEMPGLRARNDKLSYKCQQYLSKGNVTDLENLITLTRNIFGIDRNLLYFYLLQAYCELYIKNCSVIKILGKLDDDQKALNVWTNLQEEDIQPSQQIMKYLASFLQKKGRPIPFIISEESQISTTDAINVSELLQMNKLDKVLVIKQELEAQNKELSLIDQSILIEKLLQNERISEAVHLTLDLLQKKNYPTPQIFRFLVKKLANTGCVNFLKMLSPYMDYDIQKVVSFNDKLCNAYEKSGLGEDYLKSLINQNKIQEHFPRGGILGLLQRNPHLEDEYKTVCLELAKSNSFYEPFNILWMHQMMTNRFNEAEETLKYFKESSQINLAPIIQQATKQQNLEIAMKCLDILKNVDLNLSPIYSCIIEIHALKNNIAEGLNFLNTILQDGVQIQSLSISSLSKLKVLVESSGQTFPYNIENLIASRNRLPNAVLSG